MGKGKRLKMKYSFSEAFTSMIRELIVMELLLWCLLAFLRDGFESWKLSGKGMMAVQILLVALLFMSMISRIIGRKMIKILPAIVYACMAAIYVRMHASQLIQSGKVLFNDYIEFWNKQFDTNYLPYQITGQSRSYALAVLVATAFISCVLLYELIGKKFVLLFPSFFVLCGELWVNIHPGWRPLAALFAGILVLSALPGKVDPDIWQKENHGRKKEWKLFSLEIVYLAGVGILAVTILLFSRQTFGNIAGKIPGTSPVFQSFQKNLEQHIRNFDLEDLFSNKPKTRLDNTTPSYSGKEIFTIKTTGMPRGNLYFKEFASGTYQNGEWVDEGSLFKKEAEKEKIDPQKFADKLEQQIYKLSENEGDAIYSISYSNGGRDTALTPYFTAITSKDLWMHQDQYMKKNKGITSLKVRSLRDNMLTASDIAGSDSEEFRWYNGFAKEHYQNGSQEVPAAENYADEIMVAYSDKIDELGETGEERQISNKGRLELASAVAKILENRAKYNLYLDELPDSMDATEYFLKNSREGYCMHFASAATLILQNLGVPARYASGYIAKVNMFHSKGENFEAKIPDQNGHAWVEIYLDNMGWIPIEVTPGYTDAAQTLPTDPDKLDDLKKEHESQSKNASETQQTTETQTQQTTETQMQQTTEQLTQEQSEDRAGGSDQPVGKQQMHNKGSDHIAKIVWMIAGAVVFILILIGGISRIRRKRQNILKKEIETRQNRKAICRMNQRLYKKQRKHFKLPKTDKQYLENLKQMYPDILEEDWERYLGIVQKATFSKEDMSEEEMHFCYQIYMQIKNEKCRTGKNREKAL